MTSLIHSGIGFDGVVGSNDMMALGAMNALHTHNISVPSQVKVVGIDNIQNSAIATPALSTVSFSQSDIALTAFIMLKELMNNRVVPDEILIPGKLIVRKST
ncbi:HTH-type transcriptional repressor PurR [bioreactor metagenome]|uniref:HTH-type transcriptional repressor PurR n=1 Tax=bioreactor metagenome TaxID=1076179 RepID=A0A645HJ18_9ZZZZ